MLTQLAYMFSELVELHAADTYAQFVESNAEALKQLPPPQVAAAYYLNEDLYMVQCMRLQEDTMQSCCST